MDNFEQQWRNVDEYLIEQLVGEDEALTDARRAARAAGIPDIEVSPTQGKFLGMIAQLVGAKRVLEFGTLAGYSAIWFARAVGPGGRVTTLELEDAHADVAQSNFERAGVSDRVALLRGFAADTVKELIANGEQPYDIVFIDADKPNNPVYLDLALQLAKPGTVIIIDNVVRKGAVVEADSSDEQITGTRAAIEAMGRDPRINATALQTVGLKGWDGFAIGIVS